MIKILLLLSGGAIGTLARYGVSGISHSYYLGMFPMGTLMVNLIGSLLIGFGWGIFETGGLSTNARTFIFIGILGGFTTFSSYTLETLNLLREGETKMAILNILANNIIGLVLVVLGFIAAKSLLNIVSS